MGRLSTYAEGVADLPPVRALGPLVLRDLIEKRNTRFISVHDEVAQVLIKRFPHLGRHPDPGELVIRVRSYRVEFPEDTPGGNSVVFEQPFDQPHNYALQVAFKALGVIVHQHMLTRRFHEYGTSHKNAGQGAVCVAALSDNGR